MTLPRMKTLVGTLWIIAAGALALGGDGLTIGRGMLLAAVGLVPPAVMLLLWNPPAQTLSESIADARRQR